MCLHQVRIDGLQAHFVIERANYELANRNLAAMGKERTHTQVGVDAAHLRGVDLPVVPNRDCAEVDSLAFQYPGNGVMGGVPFLTSLRTYRTQIAGNLICQHFLQTQAKQVRRIAAVGSCHHVTAGTCRSARPAVACSATIAETSSEAEIVIDIARTIV